MRLVTSRQGARLVQGRHTVSYALKAPGPTNSVFDLLAAAAVQLAPGPRVLMLGFAAGGTVAALRGLRFAGRVDAVDLSREGVDLFHQYAKGWEGEVHVAHAEASEWLRRDRHKWDAIIEDLTLQDDGEVRKAPVALDPLPTLVPQHLRQGGVAIWNALPVEGVTWEDYTQRTAGQARAVRVISFDDYTNRVILCADRLPPAAELSRALRRQLDWLGSVQADRFRVATWR